MREKSVLTLGMPIHSHVEDRSAAGFLGAWAQMVGPRGVPSAKGDPGYREGMRMRMVVARLRDLAHEAEVSIPTSPTDPPVERRHGERRGAKAR